VLRIDRDDVTVAQETDGPAHRRLGSDMPDAEATRCAREPAVGNKRHFIPHALAIYGCRGREHFAHARPTARTLVPDHEDLTRFVVPLLDGREALLLALEDARGPAECQVRQARDLHDGTL